MEPAAECDAQNALASHIQALQVWATLNAHANQQARPAESALPAPLQLNTDTNVLDAATLDWQIRSQAIAALLQAQAQTNANGLTTSSASASSAFSPVHPDLNQAVPADSTTAPALFKAQQNTIPSTLSHPITNALAQLFRPQAAAVVPASALPPTSIAAAPAVMPPNRPTAAAAAVSVMPQQTSLASDSYIPQSLLPRDPATQESILQERREKLRRFQAKKRGRGAPSVRYASRKKYADSRPRVKGRFIRKTADDNTEAAE